MMTARGKKTAHNKICFGSKADTLFRLDAAALSCRIPPGMAFTWAQWKEDPSSLLEHVRREFAGRLVAVRSSARHEDGAVNSHAGAYTSVLHVPAEDALRLRKAVEQVFASYPRTEPEDQILIQLQVEDIEVSGVILTRCVDDGSPYYVLNYDEESGRSDSVTSGRGVHKTVLVYRHFRPEYCDSPRVRKMLELAKEMERLGGSVPLDIEFALDRNGQMHLLQVRRISTAANWHPDTELRVARAIPHTERFVRGLSARRKGLFGASTIFGIMPDWNPAELLGGAPAPLAVSLFRALISASAWRVARAGMGYRELPGTELMVLLGGKPFIDVRASLNSLLPGDISARTGEKLINAWLRRLADNPGLHDKIEFEVAQTALDFTFSRRFAERYPGVLSASEHKSFQELLCGFTNQALRLGPDGTLDRALGHIAELRRRQKTGLRPAAKATPPAMSAHIQSILETCLRLGTIPFATIARHAFIAEALLRSAAAREALDETRLAVFKASVPTVMSELAADMRAVCRGDLSEKIFLEHYGHLRPGTFDIMSPCYRDRDDLFLRPEEGNRPEPSAPPFTPRKAELRAIGSLLRESGLDAVSAGELFTYAARAIQGREYAKFIFTRSLSAALECIARWGAAFGLGREDLSFLRLPEILDSGCACPHADMTSALMDRIDRARMEQTLARSLRLSYLVRGVKDIHVVPLHRCEPNFITRKQVERETVFLSAASLSHAHLENRIVCIEHADPGFDWIFTRGIAGLVTKYGGANSHMAIRCAELQLPAAIGCGEELFDRLRQSPKIDLNCAARNIAALGAFNA